jgi:hypothetical protein
LTQIGMNKMYELGLSLKEKYSDLAKFYNRKNVHVITGNDDLLTMSANSFTAGFFKPVEWQIFNKSIEWQPVSIRFESDVEFCHFSLIMLK